MRRHRLFLLCAAWLKPCRLVSLLGMLILFAGQPMLAQTPLKWGIGMHAGVSHGGWNLALVGQVRVRDFQAYAGPSFTLGRGTGSGSPIGFNGGLDAMILSKMQWLGSLVNLDYQFQPLAGKDQLHSLHLGYGLRFDFWNGFFLAQQLGYGVYWERVHAVQGGDIKSYSGYSGLVRVRAGYQF